MARVTHGEIADAIDGVRYLVEDLSHRIHHLQQQVGHDPDDGSAASGLIGRIIRMERRLTGYDRIKDRLIGGLAAISIAATALWWLIKGKVAAVFGVGS